MNNAQRKTILITCLILAPVLFVAGVEQGEILLVLAGPIIAIAVGLFVWAGRDR